MSEADGVVTAVPWSLVIGSRKGQRVALWVVQLLLAVRFGLGGAMKLGTPIVELAPKLPWVSAVPEGLVRFIGASELAGAIGLVLPALTRIRPGLTALAGFALAVVMLLAGAFHVSRGEVQALPGNLLLGGLAVFVGWPRPLRHEAERGGARQEGGRWPPVFAT